MSYSNGDADEDGKTSRRTSERTILIWLAVAAVSSLVLVVVTLLR